MTHLIKIAASLTAGTKVAAKAALKAAGLKQTLADELLARRDQLIEARRDAPALRVTRKLGYSPVTMRAMGRAWNQATCRYDGEMRYSIERRDPMRRPTGRAPVCLPADTPAERLAAVRCTAVRRTYNSNYRTAANGEVHVYLTNTPSYVGIAQDTREDWDLYRGAYKGWAARVQDSTITVPARWRTRVERKGLAVVDGMMTLDAAELEANGCELFAATWCVQGRGTTVTSVRGYIARSGNVTFHGSTIDQALSGLARKKREVALSVSLASSDGMEALAAEYGNMRVTLGDARAIGACEYGIKSWCNAVGLNYAAGVTTLGEVIDGYRHQPRIEARATILRVLRRARVASNATA